MSRSDIPGPPVLESRFQGETEPFNLQKDYATDKQSVPDSGQNDLTASRYRLKGYLTKRVFRSANMGIVWPKGCQ